MMSPKVNLIVEWINNNINDPYIPRPHKQKQLWVCGPSNFGKTTLKNLLEERLRIYCPSLDGIFMDGYDDDWVDLIIFDEFQGQRKVTWVNSFVEGSNMQLEIKGAQVTKEKNVPVIVLSNFTPRDCWKNVPQVQIDAIYNRFEVVELFSQEEDNLFDIKYSQ